MDDSDSQGPASVQRPARTNRKGNSVTTDAHTKQFAHYIEQWQSKLNLGDWRIEPSGKPADKGAMAQVVISHEDRLAVWFFGSSFGAQEPTAEAIERTAIHELLHVRLAEFKEACVSRDAQRIEQIEHGLITIFERLLYRGKHA